MAENENVALVKKGFEAFNTADIATLRGMFADDAQQHIPGKSQFAGDYSGRDDILVSTGSSVRRRTGHSARSSRT